MTHPEPLQWAYDPVRQAATRTGTATARSIIMAQPVPTPMSVADLDGVNSTNGSKWRTNVTITIRDASGVPVLGAKVYGTWSYGNDVNCTTDAQGQCS